MTGTGGNCGASRESDVIADVHEPAGESFHRTFRVQTVEIVATLLPVFRAVANDVVGNHQDAVATATAAFFIPQLRAMR